MPLIWQFQHDNDPKHTSPAVKTCLQYQETVVMNWPVQYPETNPIENLLKIAKKKLDSTKTRNKEELWENSKRRGIQFRIKSVKL